MPTLDTVADKVLAIRVSPKFTAMLGAIFHRELTEPPIVQLCCTSDGMVLARHADDIGFNEMVASYNNLVRNCKGVGKVAGLTKREMEVFLGALPVPGKPC